MTYSKGIPMGEDHTFQFSKNVRFFGKNLLNTIANLEGEKQIMKTLDSTDANNILNK